MFQQQQDFTSCGNVNFAGCPEMWICCSHGKGKFWTVCILDLKLFQWETFYNTAIKLFNVQALFWNSVLSLNFWTMIISIIIRLSLNLWTMMIIRLSCIESLDHNDRRENLLFYNESHSSLCEKPLSSQTSSDDDEDDSAHPTFSSHFLYFYTSSVSIL